MGKFEPGVSGTDCAYVPTVNGCATYFVQQALEILGRDGEVELPDGSKYRLEIQKEDDPNSYYADLLVQNPNGRPGDPLQVSITPVIKKVVE